MSTDRLPYVVPSGRAARGPYALEVTPANAGWGYSGLRIVELEPGETMQLHTGAEEMIVLPLHGSARVSGAADDPGNRPAVGPHDRPDLGFEFEFELDGRDSVFTRVTDFCYLPRDCAATLSSAGGGRFALPSALASHWLPPRYGPAEDVAVELRGAGSASRQVNNFCAPDAFPADRLIAVEVLTPGGNWSSYPPHKHDQLSPTESALEEIYYFEISDPADSGAGLAYQRVYPSPDPDGPDPDGSHPDRTAEPVDVCAQVGTGDVVLIPHGYHGPSMAAPGYDLYYLNVMAGPGERVWRFCDDPQYAWIREGWRTVDLDPRLPMTSAKERL